MSDSTDKLLVTMVVLSFGLTAYVALGGDGPVGRYWKTYRSNQHTQEVLSEDVPKRGVGGGALGAGAGSDTILEVSDYECPYCRLTAPAVDEWLTQNGDVTFLYVHMPLPSHKQAAGAAAAAICAARAGAFPAMHHQLMSTTKWQEDSNWTREALASGIQDTSDFGRCLVDSTTAAILAQDIALARELTVSGTPTFFGRGGSHIGGIDAAGLNSLR